MSDLFTTKVLPQIKAQIPTFLGRISPKTLLENFFQRFPPSEKLPSPQALISLGKAAGGLTVGLSEHFHISPEKTLTILPEGYPSPPPEYPCLVGPHPVPDEQSVNIVKKIRTFAKTLSPDTPVAVAISGGSSSLLADPLPPVTINEKSYLTKQLLNSGAPIEVINAARIHLSKIKGGGLASLLFPRPCQTFILSDIPGNVSAAGLVGSSPMAFVPRNGPLMLEILEGWIGGKIPVSVRQALSSLDSRMTPSWNPPVPQEGAIIASSDTLLTVANEVFLDGSLFFGDLPLHNLTSELRGEAREAASVLASQILWMTRETQCGSVWLCSGETTVRLEEGHHPGRGGRTLELGLSLAMEISSIPALVLSLASDGWDGNSGLAGMLATSRRFSDPELQRKGRLSLVAHDTAPLLEDLGLAIKTGPTGTNLNDLLMVVVFSEGEMPR